MKWKTVKTKVKKISGEQEDKAKQSKLVNMQKKSVVQGLLNSGPASRNADTVGLKMDRSCKQEGKCSAEPEALHSKDFSSKISRKISHTEKPQTTKPSEVAVKRRRRTKIEMALSYKARGPDVLGHIMEEVVYDCPANLERRVRDKSSNMSGCMKGKESFWILDDDLIRSMQKKMETLDKKSVQSPQQNTKPKPLVGLKCLSLQRSNVFLNKELDVATIGKTIIQISHAPPARSRIAMNREPSETLMQLENFAETSGFGQTDRLEKLVQSKAAGGSVTVIEKNDHNLSPENESNAKRIHKEVRLITEECATNICHALEEVVGAGTTSFQVETQSDDVHSSELVKAAQSAARDMEYEVDMDYSGDVDVSDVDVDSLENGWNTAHSEPLSRRNAEGLTRLARLEERNGKLYKKKEIIACPNVTVERISQEHFLLGTRDHFDTIQRTHIPVIHTDISILNSVSLGRSRSTATETMNDDEEKGMTTPSAQQEMDGRRLRRRKRKQLFTRRKKCKSASPNATKVKFPSADGCGSWFLQSSITEQVLSGCRLAESGRVAEMEISPEVESAASVLAMMSSGGRIFSGFQRGERRWDSGEPWQKYHPASSTALTGFQHAGRYMCEVCGQVFMDLALLREHISEHERAELRSAHRKQLRRKQTTKTRVAQASSSSAAPPTQSESSVKSCASAVDEADKPLLKVQNVECEVQQLCDQPVTTDAQPDIFIGLSQGDDVSQISEADLAAGNMASVTNNKEEVVKLKEGACDEKEIASKNVNPGQDKGILQAVEGELGGIAPPASAESVLGKDTAQDSVNLKQSLCDKTGVDSAPQTNVAVVQAIVGDEDIVEISDSEEEECVYIENAKPILIDMKGAVCNSKLVGQKRCKRNASGSTDIRYETREELNAANKRSALFGSSCTDPESSSFYPTDEHLTELVEQVVGAMKISGSVFGSEYPSKSKTGAAWATTVCHICNRKFSNSANTRKHIRMTHNSYRPHKCKICGKAFPYPSSLSEHMTSHATNPQKFVCYICGKVFVRQSGLRKHIKEQHETFRPHACNVCDKSFIYRCLLREHQRSHSEERTFKCTECSSVFKQMSNLLMHMKKRHQSTCECPAGNCVCEPKTARPLPSFSCVICSKVFHDRRQLESHVDSHDGRNPLTCKVCDKVFPNKFVLSKHRMKHQETKVYSCEVCSRSFLSKPALKSHRRTHLGVKPYQCESCGKQYTTKNSLKIHSVRHLEVLPHACDKCNKKFAVQANLTKHMAMHTKEHVFVCCHCDQTFYCNTDLKKHILQHDEQKTYVCPYCSKKFLHQSNLKMHAVKHTGERPHSCGVCGRCFSLKANLRRHMQTHMRKNGHIINESSIPIPGAYVVLGPE